METKGFIIVFAIVIIVLLILDIVLVVGVILLRRFEEFQLMYALPKVSISKRYQPELVSAPPEYNAC